MLLSISKLKLIGRIAVATGLGVSSACGDEGTGPSEDPKRLEVHWVSVALMQGALAPHSSCGLTDEGTAYCWGENFGFTNGHPLLNEGAVNEPIPVDGGIAFKQLTAGFKHTCGLSQSGDAYCWGSTGQQGYSAYAWTPQLIPGGLTFDLLSAGTNSTCGLTEDGTAYCWTGHENQPVAVPGGLTFKDLGDGTCGLSLEGDLYCWQIPVWSEQENWTEEPVRLSAGLELEVLAEHTPCALDQAGSIHCWTFEGTHSQWEMAGLHLIQLTNLCGITEEGAAYCWFNGNPLPIPGDIDFEILSYGEHHMCGTTPDGRAFCWGCNAYGQLGDGTEPVSGFSCPNDWLFSSEPVLVKNPRE